MIIELDIRNLSMLNWLSDYLIGHKGFICGGCFKNIFNGEKAKDLDIFFRNEYDWANAVDYFNKESNKFVFYYENKKVKAYKNKQTGVVIELCRTIFGTPKEIIKQFDFTITKFAYYSDESEDDLGETHVEIKCVCDDKFFEHLHLKRLVIDEKIPFPMATFERVLRYVRYGYLPCRETKLKLAKAISKLPKEAIEVSDSLYNGMD